MVSSRRVRESCRLTRATPPATMAATENSSRISRATPMVRLSGQRRAASARATRRSAATLTLLRSAWVLGTSRTSLMVPPGRRKPSASTARSSSSSPPLSSRTWSITRSMSSSSARAPPFLASLPGSAGPDPRASVIRSIRPSLPSRSDPFPIRPSISPSVKRSTDQEPSRTTSVPGQSRTSDSPSGAADKVGSSATPARLTRIGGRWPAIRIRPVFRSGVTDSMHIVANMVSSCRSCSSRSLRV